MLSASVDAGSEFVRTLFAVVDPAAGNQWLTRGVESASLLCPQVCDLSCVAFALVQQWRCVSDWQRIRQSQKPCDPHPISTPENIKIIRSVKLWAEDCGPLLISDFGP